MKFIVRNITRDDIPIIFKFVSDYDIAYLTNYDRNMTYEEFKMKYDFYFENRSEDLKIFSIVLDNIVIGKMEIGYDMENKSGSFDIIIGNKQLWGKGLAAKALNVLFSYGFNNLGLNRISCEVFRFNERSVRLMKKMHMQVDGVLREAQLMQGKFVDIYIFSILKKEYEGDV